VSRSRSSLVRRSAFTLVEVVLALGIVSFAIVAILGVLPSGLATSHSSQNDTRAAQIAQDIFTSLASQAQVSFDSQCVVAEPATTTASDFSYNMRLKGSNTYTFSADNDGHLAVPAGNNYSAYPYQVTVSTAPDPAGFASGKASLVTLQVAWQPFSQNSRTFVRIITRY
jgi:uncharacterized protein (TIGR02598 family)